MKKILTILAVMLITTSAIVATRNAVAGSLDIHAAERTVKVEWIAKCANYGRYELRGTPTPWHKHGIQFTTISGQKIIITIGSDCMFLKVPKR